MKFSFDALIAAADRPVGILRRAGSTNVSTNVRRVSFCDPSQNRRRVIPNAGRASMKRFFEDLKKDDDKWKRILDQAREERRECNTAFLREALIAESEEKRRAEVDAAVKEKVLELEDERAQRAWIRKVFAESALASITEGDEADVDINGITVIREKRKPELQNGGRNKKRRIAVEEEEPAAVVLPAEDVGFEGADSGFDEDAVVTVEEEPAPRRRTRSFAKELECTLDGAYWAVPEEGARRNRRRTVRYAF